MSRYRVLLLIGLFGVFTGFSDGASAKGCIHSWAIPGSYTVTGNFRGTVETAGARLSRDCRVYFQVPGVFSGTKVTKAGSCLRFKFKVQKVKRSFSAKWCKTYGVVPWNGRNIRAVVKLVKRGGSAGSSAKAKKNYNLSK